VARTKSSLLRKLPPQALTSSTVADGDTVVVQLWGEHDGSTVPVLAKILASAVGLDATNLVVDLSKVQFINSATVRVFMASSESMAAQSRTFMLRSPSRSAQRVLELCDASRLIEFAQGPHLPMQARATVPASRGTRSGGLLRPTGTEGT
jgi:anti-sigma B factor antagonist